MKIIQSSEICRQLRTKAMYVPAESEKFLTEWSCDNPPQPHCWCNATLAETGEDGFPASLAGCVAGRKCHSSRQL